MVKRNRCVLRNTAVYSCANVSFVTIMSVSVAILDSHNVRVSYMFIPQRFHHLHSRVQSHPYIFRLQKPFSTFCPLHRHNSFAFAEQNAGYFQLNIIICNTNNARCRKGLCQWCAGYILFVCLNKITQYATCVYA